VGLWRRARRSLPPPPRPAQVRVGLPHRLVHPLRSRWLANGELTVAGVLLGFVAIEIVLAVAPVSTLVDELASYEARDVHSRALLIAWSLFVFSIAHFVWPPAMDSAPPLTRRLAVRIVASGKRIGLRGVSSARG
jgi:hypothetical protein